MSVTVPWVCLSQNKKSESNLGRAASPPLTAENAYATKSPLVAMGCPTFAPKLPFPFDDFHPSVDQPHLPPKRHPDAISRFTTVHRPDRPTDRQTDRPTDGLGDRSVPRAAYAYCIWRRGYNWKCHLLAFRLLLKPNGYRSNDIFTFPLSASLHLFLPFTFV